MSVHESNINIGQNPPNAPPLPERDLTRQKVVSDLMQLLQNPEQQALYSDLTEVIKKNLNTAEILTASAEEKAISGIIQLFEQSLQPAKPPPPSLPPRGPSLQQLPMTGEAALSFIERIQEILAQDAQEKTKKEKFREAAWIGGTISQANAEAEKEKELQKRYSELSELFKESTIISVIISVKTEAQKPLPNIMEMEDPINVREDEETPPLSVNDLEEKEIISDLEQQENIPDLINIITDLSKKTKQSRATLDPKNFDYLTLEKTAAPTKPTDILGEILGVSATVEKL